MIDQIPIPDSTPSIWYDKLIQPGLHGVNLIDSKISTPPHASASTIQGTNEYGTFQVRTSRSTEQFNLGEVVGFRIEMNSRENKLSDVWYEQRLNNEQRILHFKGCGISHKIDDRVNTETTDIYVTHEGKVHQATQVKNLETGETTFTFFEDQKSVDASGIPVDTLSKAFGYQTPEALLKVITDQPGRIKLVMEEIARAKFQNRDSSGVIAEIIKKEQPQPGS